MPPKSNEQFQEKPGSSEGSAKEIKKEVAFLAEIPESSELPIKVVKKLKEYVEAINNPEHVLFQKYELAKDLRKQFEKVIKNKKISAAGKDTLNTWEATYFRPIETGLAGYEHILKIGNTQAQAKGRLERFPNVAQTVDSLLNLSAMSDKTAVREDKPPHPVIKYLPVSLGERLALSEGIKHLASTLVQEINLVFKDNSLKLSKKEQEDLNALKHHAEQLVLLEKWKNLTGHTRSTDYLADLTNNQKEIPHIAAFFNNMSSALAESLTGVMVPKGNLVPLRNLPEGINVTYLGGNQNPVFTVTYTPARGGKSETAVLRAYPFGDAQKGNPENFLKYGQRTECLLQFDDSAEAAQSFSKGYGQQAIPGVAAFELVKCFPGKSLMSVIENHAEKGDYDNAAKAVQLQQEALDYTEKLMDLLIKQKNKNLIPTDIKPENLIQDDDGSLKMSDIKAIVPKSLFDKIKVELTASYMLPDIIHGYTVEEKTKKRVRNYSMDTLEEKGVPFTAAMTILQLLTGKLPVNQKSFKEEPGIEEMKKMLRDNPIFTGETGKLFRKIILAFTGEGPAMTYEAVKKDINALRKIKQNNLRIRKTEEDIRAYSRAQSVSISRGKIYLEGEENVKRREGRAKTVHNIKDLMKEGEVRLQVANKKFNSGTDARRKLSVSDMPKVDPILSPRAGELLRNSGKLQSTKSEKNLKSSQTFDAITSPRVSPQLARRTTTQVALNFPAKEEHPRQLTRGILDPKELEKFRYQKLQKAQSLPDESPVRSMQGKGKEPIKEEKEIAKEKSRHHHSKRKHK